MKEFKDLIKEIETTVKNNNRKWKLYIKIVLKIGVQCVWPLKTFLGAQCSPSISV
jgi:hypothetical protein